MFAKGVFRRLFSLYLYLFLVQFFQFEAELWDCILIFETSHNDQMDLSVRKKMHLHCHEKNVHFLFPLCVDYLHCVKGTHISL